MRRIGIAVRVLLVIALVGLGLPAGVQAQGADDGVVAEWHFDEGSEGVLGMIKASPGQYFTSPEEADRCSHSGIAGATGVPLAAVLEVVRGCWDEVKYVEY